MAIGGTVEAVAFPGAFSEQEQRPGLFRSTHSAEKEKAIQISLNGPY